MREASIGPKHWRRIWLARYSVLFFFPQFFIFIVFLEEPTWFLILSVFWTGSVFLLAWRAAGGDIGNGWKTMLAVGIAGWLALTSAVVFTKPGDTIICPQRFRKVHIWAASIPIGPDPYCVWRQTMRANGVEGY